MLPIGCAINDYFVFVRPDVVVVFALTVNYRILFARQYKQGVQEIAVELPTGTFAGESAKDMVCRELPEETGYRCTILTEIGSLFDDASKNYQHNIHLPRDRCSSDRTSNPRRIRSHRRFEVELATSHEVIEIIRRGDIASQSSVAAGYRALDEL